jgi:hypothetical protein
MRVWGRGCIVLRRRGGFGVSDFFLTVSVAEVDCRLTLLRRNDFQRSHIEWRDAD